MQCYSTSRTLEWTRRFKTDTKKNKPRKGKKSSVPQKAAPQECVGGSSENERRTGGIGKSS